jgi:predicted nucleotidyltransferase
MISNTRMMAANMRVNSLPDNAILVPMKALTDRQRAELTKQRVLAALVFGSTASGTAHKKSDVDIAILGERPISFKDRYTLQCLFGTIFSVPIHQIDIVDLRSAHPLLAFLVMTEGIALHGEEEMIDALYRSAVKRHIDAKRLYLLDQDYVRTSS